MPTSPWALKSQPHVCKISTLSPKLPPVTSRSSQRSCNSSEDQRNLYFFFFFAVASTLRCLATTLLQVIALQMVLLCWAYGFFPGHGNSSFFLHALDSKPMIKTGQQSEWDHGGHVFPPMDPIFHGLLSDPSTKSSFSFFRHKNRDTSPHPPPPNKTQSVSAHITVFPT